MSVISSHTHKCKNFLTKNEFLNSILKMECDTSDAKIMITAHILIFKLIIICEQNRLSQLKNAHFS